MRRQHGHPSALSGRWIRDPVFNDEHVQELTAWCAPTDRRPLAIEVGFQRARFAAAWCLAHPDARFFGIEVRKTFCEDADAWLQKQGVENARLALVDAREIMPRILELGSVDEVFCFFPDPWWKKKHMKKRLVTASFAAMVRELLKPDGRMVVKSDVQGYVDWALSELRSVPGLTVSVLDDATAGLPPTQRERRCALRGLPTWAIEVRREQGG